MRRSRPTRWAGPILDYVGGSVHASVRADPLEAARHRAFIAGHLAAGLAAFACLPVYLAARGGLTTGEAGAFALLGGSLMVALFLSRTGRFEAAHLLSTLLNGALVTVVALRTGGLHSAALAFVLASPIEAALSGSRRAIAWAGGAAVLAVAGVAAADLLGLVPPAAGWAAQPAVQAAGFVAAAAYAGGLALVGHRLAGLGVELRQAGEARYALLADNTADLVTRHAPGGAVTYASPAALALLGAEPGSLVGRGLFDRVHVADRPAFLHALQVSAGHGGKSHGDLSHGDLSHGDLSQDDLGEDDVGQGGAEAPADIFAELRLRRGEGEAARFVWTEMRCRPDGRGVIAVTRDIEARKAHEATLEAARQDAERASAAKSRFLATMSHELRTPLNAIIGFSELLRHEELMPLDATRRREYAGLIHDSGHHLLSVVNGLLDMSRIETGNFRLTPGRVRLAEVVEGCRGLMALKAEAGGVSLHTEIEAGLPEIVADAGACRQVVLNLLSNAIKFTPAGGRIAVELGREREGLALTVRDSGIGIAAEDLPHLGEAFFQARASYDRPYEGTGLGLSVVKGLAELHGGGVEVRSTLGRGTAVTVRLPLDCEAARPPPGPRVERLPARRQTAPVGARDDAPDGAGSTGREAMRADAAAPARQGQRRA